MSKDKKRLVPVRRFKEFENSAAWELRKLGELAPLRGGYAFKSENYTEIGVPILRISNILNTGLVGNDFVKCMPINMDEEFSLQNEDVVIALSGATTGKIAILKTNMERKYYQNQRVGHFMRTDKCDYSFITILVQKSSFKKQLHSTLVAGAQPNISPKEVDSFKFLIPKSRNEQQQIGTLFKHLDELITLHQRKLDKLKRVKSAYLTELFPAEGEREPKRRFPGFTGAWELRKLGEVVKVYSGQDYKHLTRGEIPVYGTGGYMTSVNKALSYSEDAVGIGRKGTIDKPYILSSPFWTVDTLFYAIPEEQYNLNFIYAIFKRIPWKKFDESTGVPSLSKKTIANIVISTSNIDEQQKIGSFFKHLDELITLHQRKLDKLKKMKAAYLNEMFV